jgi:hypothetical protein
MDDLTAGAGDRDRVVVGVNALFHFSASLTIQPCIKSVEDTSLAVESQATVE